MLYVRLLVSIVVSLAAVGLVVVIAVNTYYPREKLTQVIAWKLNELTAEEKLVVEELLAAERNEKEEQSEFQKKLAALEEEFSEPDKPVEQTRPVKGFVQLEYTIQDDGRVTDVEVIGAMPEGVYEERARNLIMERDFSAASSSDSKITEGRHSEVINFGDDE